MNDLISAVGCKPNTPIEMGAKNLVGWASSVLPQPILWPPPTHTTFAKLLIDPGFKS